MTIQVEQKALRDLFLELGYKAASRWPASHLEKKLTELPGMVDEDTECESEESQEILDSLLAAFDEDEEIEIVEDGELEDGEEEDADEDEEEQEEEDADEDEEEQEEEEPALEDMSMKELKAVAKERGVRLGAAARSKSKIIERLNKAEEDEEELEEETEEQEEEVEEEKPKKKAARGKKSGSKSSAKKTSKKKKADEEETEDEDEETTKRQGPAGGDGKPGVIMSIVEFLQGASKTKPLSRDDVADKLAERFPERPRKSMRTTCSKQIPHYLKKFKDIDVSGDSKNGFWIETRKKAESKSSGSKKKTTSKKSTASKSTSKKTSSKKSSGRKKTSAKK